MMGELVTPPKPEGSMETINESRKELNDDNIRNQEED